jgi:hypothetical protein
MHASRRGAAVTASAVTASAVTASAVTASAVAAVAVILAAGCDDGNAGPPAVQPPSSPPATAQVTPASTATPPTRPPAPVTPTGLPTTPAPAATPSPMIGAEFSGEGMTQAQASTLQRAVDEGHQPWRADPELVAQSFVAGRFGWPAGDVTTARVAENRVIVTFRPTGSKVGLVVAQPARRGVGGIWTVVRGYHLT